MFRKLSAPINVKRLVTGIFKDIVAKGILVIVSYHRDSKDTLEEIVRTESSIVIKFDPSVAG